MSEHQAHRRPPHASRARISPGCLPLRSGDLAAVLEAASAGEEWAWTTLITKFRPVVLSVARRYRLARAEQEEVAQETWLRLFRNVDTIRAPAALGGWIAATARHEALRVLHGAGREVVVEPEHLPEQSTSPDMDASLVERERRDALERALQGVPGRQQALLRMLMRNPTPSYEHISAALGMPVGSIGPSRARAIERLRGDHHLARVVTGTDRPLSRPSSRRVHRRKPTE